MITRVNFLNNSRRFVTEFLQMTSLKVGGSNVADNCRRFKEQFENYELVSHLINASQEKRVRPTVFLTCIGNDVYRAFHYLQLTRTPLPESGNEV